MQIIKIKMADIMPYENNVKLHPKQQIEQIKKSIVDFGNNDPIAVDENNVIIEGHGRYEALKELGYEEAECIVLTGLTEDQKNAYRLVHNKLTMNSDFDMKGLEEELNKIKMDLTAFDFEPFNVDEEEKEIIEDEAPEVDEEYEPIAKVGDIWELGNHRLMCGDSTDKAIVELLMNGNKADMVFTDPPYNIGYQGVTDKRTIKNDKMSDNDFIKFLEKSLMIVDTAYVCCSWQYCHLFKKALENIGMPPKAMIIWNKVNAAQHLDKYFKQHEIIYYYGKFGGEKTLRGDIWEIKRQRNTVHPTMKPIELIALALKDQPDKKIVYDPFGGSGSTLIASEQLDRKCYMMELDPKYCDVIIKRWETLTGKKAKLIKEEK